jgi:hypothetical protein
MPTPISDATRWLAELLEANYGRSSETYVYARQACRVEAG